MQIFVKNLYGLILNLVVEPSDTIATVKAKIQEQQNYPHDPQLLIFAGRLLDDDRTLADYTIQADAMLHMVISAT
jgi:ubiquitin